MQLGRSAILVASVVALLQTGPAAASTSGEFNWAGYCVPAYESTKHTTWDDIRFESNGDLQNVTDEHVYPLEPHNTLVYCPTHYHGSYSYSYSTDPTLYVVDYNCDDFVEIQSWHCQKSSTGTWYCGAMDASDVDGTEEDYCSTSATALHPPVYSTTWPAPAYFKVLLFPESGSYWAGALRSYYYVQSTS